MVCLTNWRKMAGLRGAVAPGDYLYVCPQCPPKVAIQASLGALVDEL